ncbi:MAG: tautomerase family protein [Pseudomonadota bacterium]
MPLYLCNTKRDQLDGQAKQRIAHDITQIHCDVTGAPAKFVHVMFFEDAAHLPLEGKALRVRGSIRKGRSDDQKARIAAAIRSSLARHGKVVTEQADAVIQETPASWVLEGGEIMPEPGEEAAWLEAQAARGQAPAGR